MDFFSIPHLLIILAVVVLIFGTKRLPSVGKDLSEAVRAFKKGLKDENPDDKAKIDKPADPAKPDADKSGPDR
jgi:TatA/E family protein of Tat protein translocase